MGGNHFNSEMGQQIAWEEANAIRAYFLSQGMSHDRMFIDYNYTFKGRYVMIRGIEFCDDCSRMFRHHIHNTMDGKKLNGLNAI